MTPPPERPRVYHITHVDNLHGIVANGGLLSDAAMVARGGPVQGIGMSSIKRRRIQELAVPCHAGTKVGDYVPFYFCPRSVMLYVIHRANHPELTYRGGQEPVVHLEADLLTVVRWADTNGVRWAFSLTNAGAYYTEFRSRTADLNQLDWPAIAATDFRHPDVKERKQAEFLVHGRFPFWLIERIGVRSAVVRQQVTEALARADHAPTVELRPEWYF
jgi:hypothetical protein